MIGKLFQLAFLHGYFASGKFVGCQLVPDAATAQLIDRYRLQARWLDGCYSLHTAYQDSAEQLLGYLHSQDSQGVFRFYLLHEAASFHFMTELPVDWVGQLALDSTSAQAVAGGGYALTPAYAARMSGPGQVIAVVSIRMGDLLAMGGHDVDLTISFQARAVRWAYYLINRSAISMKSPAVIGNNGKIFDGPEVLRLPEGEEALGFNSGSEQYLLQETPQLRFDLIDRPVPSQPTVQHCLVRGLPAPKPDQLNVARDAGGSRLSCAMRVYL